ncbi:MAG TPA: hypothetical protein P5300_08250, partial [Acidobacteriota bacterium]|nr:hypothetical protein [Acidobacteriota bacterium]
PDRRTAVSAVNVTAGEPPTRSRRRGRLRSLPTAMVAGEDAGATTPCCRNKLREASYTELG